MKDNLMKALKQSQKENGKAQVVKDETGKIIGYCGVMQKGETSFECLCKGMIASIETQ
jgi:RPA family protein